MIRDVFFIFFIYWLFIAMKNIEEWSNKETKGVNV